MSIVYALALLAGYIAVRSVAPVEVVDAINWFLVGGYFGFLGCCIEERRNK